MSGQQQPCDGPRVTATGLSCTGTNQTVHSETEARESDRALVDRLDERIAELEKQRNLLAGLLEATLRRPFETDQTCADRVSG